jgi:hypothetical protein
LTAVARPITVIGYASFAVARGGLFQKNVIVVVGWEKQLYATLLHLSTAVVALETRLCYVGSSTMCYCLLSNTLLPSIVCPLGSLLYGSIYYHYYY